MVLKYTKSQRGMLPKKKKRNDDNDDDNDEI